MKKRTFVDSGVLLTAFRGIETEAEDAFKILEDPNREFVSSIFVQMEQLPKAIYHRNEKEIRFYEAFFDAVSVWVRFTEDLLQAVPEEAKRGGIAAMDALHVVAAASANSDEFVTTEGSFKRYSDKLMREMKATLLQQVESHLLKMSLIKLSGEIR